MTFPCSDLYQTPAGVTHIIIIKRGDLESGNVEVVPARSYADALNELRERAVTEWRVNERDIANASLEDLQSLFGEDREGWELTILPLNAPRIPLV